MITARHVVGARLSCAMPTPDAALLAVLRTLVRATADQRTPVTLRTGDPARAAALARWLAAAHGSPRTVLAARAGHAEIEVRLPRRTRLPVPPPLLPLPPAHHLSRMSRSTPPAGTP